MSSSSLVFLHLQKTGGSTIHHLLKQHLPADRLVPKDRTGYIQQEIKSLDGKVISGHVTARFVKILAGTPQVFTVLRDPAARLLSHFYFIKGYTHKHLATYKNEAMLQLKALTFAEFLRDPKMNVWCGDFYVKALDPLYDKANPQAVKPSAERALEFLQQCAVVGIMPCLQAFVRQAFPYFGITSSVEVPCINRRHDLESQPGFEPVEVEPMTQEDGELIEKLTRDDRLLYEYALSVAPR